MQSLTSAPVLKEWSCEVAFRESELRNGSFSVCFFFGSVPSDPNRWLSDPNYAGSYDVYGGGYLDSTDEEDQVLRGYVQLNKAIAHHATFESFEPNVVVPFLKPRLNWGIVRSGVGIVPIRRFPSLEIVVLCTPLTITPGAEYPTRGTPVFYTEVTEGKPGGYKNPTA